MRKKNHNFMNKIKEMPIVEEVVEKLDPILNFDDDDMLDKLNPLDKFSDKLKDWKNKLKPKLPPGLQKLWDDVKRGEDLMKKAEGLLGFSLPGGLNGFLNDPYGSNEPYGPKELYGINGKYGPDGFFGPNSQIGPYGPKENTPFGSKGTHGLNGIFGPSKIKCQETIQEVYGKFKEKFVDLLKDNIPVKLKDLFGGKLDKLKKTLNKAKDLFKAIDDAVEKIQELPKSDPEKKAKELFRKTRKVKREKLNLTRELMFPQRTGQLPHLPQLELLKELRCL
ncbi:Protein CBG25693 [Caenorhabditis briggsae]|uniref:Protein CBG25693 n=1 Tax=Caenorhabditis briggsae TaxID=6238 RepID=B6IKP9_CAEBR|nr:Protein CBG25693 [Caenorhabditis briggsae]CAS00479.1 Protein CBG25693 [Caenorhabditis briggsae]